jgi:uncharacterized protein (DUF2147 family)
MSKKYLIFSLFCLLAIFSALGVCAANSPVGLWKTIDDNTGKPRSLVRITQTNDAEFVAIIEKGLQAEDTPDDVCAKCTGELKNKPLLGMTIMQGMKQNGDVYEGGKILDPDNGKVYKCKLKLIDDGNKLEVRGFIGISLFGRSQTWVRQE